MRQCDIMICVKPFTFRISGQRGRAITVKEGDKFWIVTPEYVMKRAENKIIEMARKGKNMADAYPFAVETVAEYFKGE